MVTTYRPTLLIVTMMLTSGCAGLTNQDNTPDIDQIDCNINPNHNDCFKVEIIEGDCNSKEVFTGTYCRIMVRPQNLNYGEKSILLIVGQEMQNLTPSFLGDGPETWQINPPLPDGFALDSNSGVISGIPINSKELSRYTIIARNNAGFSTTTLDIVVSAVSPKSISYEDEVLYCVIDIECYFNKPIIQGGIPDKLAISPDLPNGITFYENGSIGGVLGIEIDANYTVTATNNGGLVFTEFRLISIPQIPSELNFINKNFTWIKYDFVKITPLINGSNINAWSIEPLLPQGLRFIESDGSIEGKPIYIQDFNTYRITASNSQGTIFTDINIKILDLPVVELAYDVLKLDLIIGDNISFFNPKWEGGNPVYWEISPEFPEELFFNYETGIMSGIALQEQDWIIYTIWANNSGGSDSTIISIRVLNQQPSNISWPQEEYILESNKSINISPLNFGPDIESWDVVPNLPSGLYLSQNGTIEGTPNERTNWDEYTVWSNNTGGSFSSKIWIVVHDLAADQFDLLNGMSATDWGGWPSPILPIGKWAFPIGFTEGGYTSDIPVISGSHVGKGKMIGFGHEGWVTGGGAQETAFSLRAVNWVCGKDANVGISYGTGFESFQDELESDGHTVTIGVTPDDLSNIDCLLDEFWNGHSNSDNNNITEFLLSGGGLIMGGHAWYWSYSNSDLSHNYPGNKIAKTTGLFVSNDWGYDTVNLENIPHLLSRPYAAIEAITSDRLDGEKLSESDAIIVDDTLSICTEVISLDFHSFWFQLRETVNLTGWTVIEYGTLWQDVGYNMGEDPIADVLLRVEEALTQKLPANELTSHPSHVEFPGEIPGNTTRVSKLVNVDGNQSGLPSEFGYSGARSILRMSTGLYAAPGDVIDITINQSLTNQGVWVIIGTHSDNLWSKDQLHRFPNIVRYWDINEPIIEVGNSFGGPIYVGINAGSILGNFDILISNAINAPHYINKETNLTDWIENIRNFPAPWAEIGSDLFILSVPSFEIRNLNNPEELMDWWDQAIGMEHSLYGFTPWPRIERAVFDVQISAGWMHSGYPFMAHDLSVPDVLNLSHMSEEGDWGMFHELGHNHQWMPSTLPGNTETSCNFASVYLMEDLVGVSGHDAVDPQQRESRISSYFDGGSNISNWSVWTALDTFLIIKEEWGWAPLTNALSVYYDMPANEVPSGDIEEFNAWTMHISNATGYNLAPYHEAWGFPLNQDTFEELSHLPVWVDDPLRGEYFSYPAIIRLITTSNVSSDSVDINWQTYDNGTDIILKIYYGTSDSGAQISGWPNSVNVGATTVGNESYNLDDLSCCGTQYYARILTSNEGGNTWSEPISWSTENTNN